MMGEENILTCILAFLAVFVPYLVATAWVQTRGRRRSDSFLKQLPAFYRMSWRFVETISIGLGHDNALLGPARREKYTKAALKSGYPLTAENMLAGQIFGFSAGVITMGLGFFILSGNVRAAFGLGFLGAFLGWVYPVMIVEKRAQERQREIIRSLPFAIDLIASAMRAGLDFGAAIRHYVSLGSKGALTVEFGLLLRQMELGTSRLEALEEMEKHVQTAEFSAFVGAIAHGTEIGASIIDTLLIQGEDMRRARFNLAEQKAARAPALMIFPIAMFILPSVFAIVLVPVFLRFKAAKGG